MISTLVDLLVSFEAMARRLHSAIPADQMSLQFLGLVYFQTGRTAGVKRLFDKLRLRRVAPVEMEPKSKGE